MFQTMLTVGLDVIRRRAVPKRLAAVLCQIMLNRLARRPLRYSTLDKSKAFAAATRAIQSWENSASDEFDSEAERLPAVARAEFGRRGYEITTVREIAAAAGVSPATLTRVGGTKPEILALIMKSFGARRCWLLRRVESRLVTYREDGCDELGAHQRRQVLPRRIPHPTGVDAAIPSRYIESGIRLCATHAPPKSAA